MWCLPLSVSTLSVEEGSPASARVTDLANTLVPRFSRLCLPSVRIAGQPPCVCHLTFTRLLGTWTSVFHTYVASSSPVNHLPHTHLSPVFFSGVFETGFYVTLVGLDLTVQLKMTLDSCPHPPASTPRVLGFQAYPTPFPAVLCIWNSNCS